MFEKAVHFIADKGLDVTVGSCF